MIVAELHWLDELNKRLARSAPRRGILSAAAGLAVVQHLGTPSAAGRGGGNGGKNKGGGNGKGGGGNSNGRKRPARCGKAICAKEFIGEQTEKCEKKCGRCKIKGQFCVIEGSRSDPSKVATCCHRDQQCCQGTSTCAPKDATCCGGYPEQYAAPFCPKGFSCCASNAADYPCCLDETETCCPGVGCTALATDPKNCNACGNACADGQICRDGECVCADPCPHGMSCRDTSGEVCGANDSDCRCWCGPHFKYCPNINGGVCASQNAVC